MQSQSEKSIAESHHIDISTDGYNDCHSNMSIRGHIKDVAEVDEEIEGSHTNISTMDMLMMLNVNIKLYPLMRI